MEEEAVILDVFGCEGGGEGCEGGGREGEGEDFLIVCCWVGGAFRFLVLGRLGAGVVVVVVVVVFGVVVFFVVSFGFGFVIIFLRFEGLSPAGGVSVFPLFRVVTLMVGEKR